MSDQTLEQAIQQKGLAGARVNLEHIENLISQEYYIRASDALKGTPGELTPGCQRMTLCFLVLKNGFVVVGEGVCADPKNYVAEFGHRAARAHAIQKIWELEGYLLRQKIFEQQGTT